MNIPRSLNSGTPFVSTAREYIDKGWAIVPLPERQKEHPPTGFSGRPGKFADDEDLTAWLTDPKYARGNIALRLGNMLTVNGTRYEVIGIDVDAYGKKQGAKELSALIKKLGELPDTWISSARDNGVSGIRFFLVPYGYGFRGKASDSIDIIQRVHRYAVCFPSWHPDTKSQYFWYKPGDPPDGNSISIEIPNAADLPVLPDKWIDYLTRERMSDNDFGDHRYGIDLDVSNEELSAWVDLHFNPPITGEPGGMCIAMRKLVEKHISDIEASPTNHDKITNAHWSLIRFASEGHSGWQAAIEEVEAVWTKDIMDKGKRPLSMVRREIIRSRQGTLRKLKAKADTFAAQGVSFFNREVCMDTEEIASDTDTDGKGPWIMRIPIRIKGFDPKDYDKNDVGQARHFYDRVVDNVRYLADYNAWIIYDGNTWHIDDFALVRDLFHRACVVTSKKRGAGLAKRLAAHIATGGSDSDAIGSPLKRDSAKCFWVAEHYGNDQKIKAALTCMKSIPGVGMKFNELNWDTTILAMPDGKCLRLDEPTGKPNPKALGFKVIDNDKSFFTTMSTAVQYGEIPERERTIWLNYLDLFLPDKEYRRFVQKALGHILIGGNPEKLAIFLVGKRHTGKTTMINAMMACLKDYGETFQPASVFKDAASGLNPELGNLLHKRGIFSSESGSQRIDANSLKRNTGGDKVSITRKHANSQIIGVPHFCSIVATNASPIISEADEALIKRILVCPFDTQVTPENDDKRADITIPRDAQHAVFHWLIMGYRLYIREGLAYAGWHPLAQSATLEFAAELSDVSTFLNEMCIVAPDDIRAELNRDVINPEHEKLVAEWSGVTVTRLHDAYVRECDGSQQKPLTRPRFGRKVKQVFGIESKVVSVNGNKVRVYVGLKWCDESAMNQFKG